MLYTLLNNDVFLHLITVSKCSMLHVRSMVRVYQRCPCALVLLSSRPKDIMCTMQSSGHSG